MHEFPIGAQELAASFWRNRKLIKSLAKREILGRYRGSILGVAWSLFNPILMLGVYTFVFSVVFRARWNGGDGSRIEFALVLFSGLIIFNIFAECIMRAPVLILQNVNYVKKVVFPLEILPWVSLGSSLFNAGVSGAVWLAAYTIFIGVPHTSLIWLPLVLVPLVLMIMGLCWFISALGVYVRDVSQVVSVVVPMLMFVSPLFFPASALPDQYRALLAYNPLASILELARSVMMWGKAPDLQNLLGMIFSSSIVSLLGFAWFQKTRRGFADIL